MRTFLLHNNYHVPMLELPIRNMAICQNGINYMPVIFLNFGEEFFHSFLPAFQHAHKFIIMKEKTTRNSLF